MAIPLIAILWLAIPRGTCACTPSLPPVTSPVEGVVVAVDSSGLGKVAGFSLRTASATISFELGALENATSFSPSHLTEHMASSQPVRVFFRLENGNAVVYRLEDAVPSSPAAT